MLDPNTMREHHREVSFVLDRFMTEHLVRVYQAFDKDITAAIVLGAIDERACSAMAISKSTGIPRETVRRKIRALIKRGWLKQLAPDNLVVTNLPARHFAEFNLETLERFHSTVQDLDRLVQRRGSS